MVRLVIINFFILSFLFLIGEIAGRFYGSIFISHELAWRWINFTENENINVIQGDRYPVTRHPILGYVPRPGNHVFWGNKVLNIRKDFTRSNSKSKNKLGVTKILAVGDSFTFGDQVSDWETWPAHLSRILGINVVNAGVFGYGLGQIYLRAADWLEQNTAQGLILGIIPDHINRTGLIARMGVSKPTFFIKGNDIVLQTAAHNSKKILHPANQNIEKIIKPLRSVLGYSFIMHQLLHRAFPEVWRAKRFYLRGHNQEQEVSCRLLEKFAQLGIPKRILFIQYPAHHIIIGQKPDAVTLISKCAKREGFYIVDSFEPLRALFSSDKKKFSRLYIGHMSPMGNRYSAQLLAESVALKILLPLKSK